LRSRWAVLSAAGIYGDIARKVHAAGDRAWDHRIGTSKGEKLAHIARAAWRSVCPLPASPEAQARAGLWARPRA
jgi:phytoene synthase